MFSNSQILHNSNIYTESLRRYNVPILLAILLIISFDTLAKSANHQEKNGKLVIEAENFATQHKDIKRRWMVFSKDSSEHKYADNDLPHYENASGGKYIEILPDTRTNHFEPLIRGENFSNIPGKIAILSYPVYFNTAGKYYVWARAYSTGSEDNGVHFGINGTWPETGQRLQLCTGKHQWTWSSAQRTNTNHCGTPNSVTLEIPNPGLHNITISMREDGFELDKFLLTTDSNFVPQGIEAASTLTSQPSMAQKNILHEIKEYSRILFATKDFTALSSDTLPLSNKVPLHKLKQEHALAINTTSPAHHNIFSYVHTQIDRRDAGKRKLTLVALSNHQSASKYKVLLNNIEIGNFVSLKTTQHLQEQYFEIPNINLKQGDTLTVASMAVLKAHLADTKMKPVGGYWRALVIK